MAKNLTPERVQVELTPEEQEATDELDIRHESTYLLAKSLAACRIRERALMGMLKKIISTGRLIDGSISYLAIKMNQEFLDEVATLLAGKEAE